MEDNQDTDQDRQINDGGQQLGEAPIAHLKKFVTGHGVDFPDTERKKALREAGNRTWDHIFSKLQPTIHDNSVILFCGAKNNGKSSFIRYVVNRTIKSMVTDTTNSSSRTLSSEFDYVYYMDCDPGQPEMTTPGVLSAHLIKSGEDILVPPYLNTLQHEPVAISSVAGTNMSSDPMIYIDTCQHIFKQIQRHKQKQGKSAPVFINTMGHIRNVGLAMLVDLIKLSQPTEVVVLNIKDNPDRTIYCDFSPDEIDRAPSSFLDAAELDSNWRNHKTDKLNYQLFVEELEFSFIDSQTTATKNRLASMLAYLAHIPEALYLPIERIPPKYLKMSGLLTFCASSFPLKPNIVLDLLPNSWIHLCHINSYPHTMSQSRHPRSEIDNNCGQLTLARTIRNNSFYGCGIILNLNLNEGIIELITPLDQDTLNTKINLIIKPLSIQAPSVIYRNMEMDE